MSKIILCPFCQALADHEELYQWTTKDKLFDENRITVAIVEEVKKDDIGVAKWKSLGTAYRRNGLGWELKYCPMCGRKLK